MEGFEHSKENYRLYECIGRGGFGEVYRARSLLTGQDCAIKLIEKKAMAKKGMLKRVLNEVEIHSRLKHPSILELYSYFEDSNYIYLDLEYCSKGDLQSCLRRRREGFDENEVREMMTQIVEGIVYLQRHMIIHRDLKLSNILISRNDSLKIADFGLAIKLQDDTEKHNTMCGTLNYISPEVLQRTPHGLEVDLWSIGCMLYNLLTGKPPFEGEKIKGTIEKVREGDFEVPEYVSTEASQLIHMLLQNKPEDRLKLEQILLHPFFLHKSCKIQSIYKKQGGQKESGRVPPSTQKLSFSIISNSQAFNSSHVSIYSPSYSLKKQEKNHLANQSSHRTKMNNSLPFSLAKMNGLDKKWVFNRNQENLPILERDSNKKFLQNINSSEEDKGFTSSTSFANQAFNSPTSVKYFNEQSSDLESSLSSKNFEVASVLNTPLHQSLNSSQDIRLEHNFASTSGESNFNRYFQENKNSKINPYNPINSNNISSPIIKCKSFENMGAMNFESYKCKKKSFSINKTSEKVSLIDNFSTARLRPMKHKTKNAFLTIAVDGTLYADFFRVINSVEKIYKSMKISNKKVHLFEPKTPIIPDSHGPLVGDKCSCFDLWSLPQGWRSKLEYVCHFVSLVRSKTPKVTIFTSRAKCMLMENLPIPEFQVDFYTGYRFLVTDKQTTIKELDSTCITLTAPSKTTHLSPQLLSMWNYVTEMRETCNSLERLSINSDPNFSCFPLTLGRKSLYESLMSSSSSSSSKRSKLKEVLSDERIWKGSPKNENEQKPDSTYDHYSNKNPRRCTSEDRIVSPLSIRNKCAGVAVNNTFQNSNLKNSLSKSYSGIPNAFSNGTVMLQNTDGSRVSIDDTAFEVVFTDTLGKQTFYSGRETLPESVSQGLQKLHRVMSSFELSKHLSVKPDAKDLHV